MKKKTDCKAHWCGGSMQSVVFKAGIIHICILYCMKCTYCYNRGYLQPETVTGGVSVISGKRAEQKAIKAWNKRYYQWK